MRKEDLLDLFAIYEQHDIIKYYKKLDPKSKKLFLKNIESLDLKLVFELYKKFSMPDCIPSAEESVQIKPAPVITTPETDKGKEKLGNARHAGETLLRDGKVAVLIVAGGQGSRLGFEGPKGIYKISPIQQKSLFQLFSEQIKALSKRYNTSIPLIIMTSEENHDDTIQFFESKDYFGLEKKTFYFFQQDMLPAITPDGKLVLQNDARLFANPNGHGGSLKALYDSGVLGALLKEGFTELFYCQVDNPLVKIADPVFLGYHTMARAEASTKVVRRRSIEEKVGVYVSCNGKDTVIEYSDMSPQNMSALDDAGDILYWAGNTAIHIFSLSFIQRINNHGFALPYHCARKNTVIIDQNGKPARLDVWKFETFVFDAIPLAERTCCMEIAREEEFAPVKNKDGADSPETARSAMINLYRNWLKKSGVNVAPEAAIEISPLFALDEDEFHRKIKKKNMFIKTDRYFGE
ncbi:MAG: UDP-N-acetylglucosamine/UDP-N-acetylgalactosamine diphosphorylase [Deltaproteobacteria bacterium]|nr:UDP-N-acetylglucosamine/UDP-N-acetylgalactosamine diphosphorylase [Deltaproteobacteria bacterium]